MRAWLVVLLLSGFMPWIAAQPGALAAPEDGLEVDLVARDRVMTGTYKVLAMAREFPNEWVGAAVLRNTGQVAVRAAAVRFRIAGFTEWSPWSSVGEVRAGKSVGVPYHPLLPASVVELQTTTPVDLEAEWTWADDSGARRGSATRRFMLLGGHEFVFSRTSGGGGAWADAFSNAPFLAAWVTREDPVLKQFAALVSRYTGGAAEILGIEDGLESLRGIYELMLLNDFVYKSPVGLVDARLSFDSNMVQNLKYPREVLRDKSGTCIELAILHAAIAHQLGIRSLLAIVPGHCFPVFVLSEQGPDGTVQELRVPLEATGIRGGLPNTGRVGFQKAVDLARASEAAAREGGRYLEVDVQAMWSHGVASAELPPVPDDALARWGVTVRGIPGITLPDVGAGARKEDPAGFEGNWEGSVQARLHDAQPRACRMTLVVAARRGERYKVLLTLVAEDGSATAQEEGVAEDQEGQLVYQGGTRRVAAADGAGHERAPGRGAARLKDGKLQGKYGVDGEGFSAFTLERR